MKTITLDWSIAQSTGKLLHLSLPRTSVVRLTDLLDMTIAVDWDVKPQTKLKARIFLVVDFQTPPTVIFWKVEKNNF